VDEESFLKCLFDTYATLAEKNGEDSGKPAYFRFLTLLGFRIFLEQQVDVAVLEVGLGGRLDATNCIREPVVCGVSALGFDHMNVLGYTLPEISREKAGIFKNGVPALTVPQREDAMETLIRVAKEKNVLSLKTVPSLDSYRLYGSKERNIELGLQGEHQAQNAALAVQLAAMWESRHGQWTRVSEGAATRSRMVLEDGILPDEYRKGLENVRWPGRGEIFEDPEAENVTFFVDGAHTPESVDACAAWFSSASSAKSSTAERVVIFNCMEERDPKSLLEPLQERLVEKNAVPSEIMFSPTISSYTKLNQQTNAVDVSWQGRLQATWDKMMEQRKVLVTGKPGSVSCQSSVAPSLHETLRHIRTMSQKLPKNKRLHVLVTGSLYLVGDMLQLLGRSA
jgi:folylpolyglutamate synthase